MESEGFVCEIAFEEKLRFIAMAKVLKNCSGLIPTEIYFTCEKFGIIYLNILRLSLFGFLVFHGHCPFSDPSRVITWTRVYPTVCSVQCNMPLLYRGRRTHVLDPSLH